MIPVRRVPAERAARYRADGLWDTRTLFDGIEAAATSRPDATALVDNHRTCTYRDLARLAAAGAAHLSSYGVRAGDGVVLVAGNTVDAAVAYHALLRVGAVTALLDRRCGVSDLRNALDALEDVALVVVPNAERERLTDDLDVDVVTLETFGEARDTASDLRLVAADRDAPAIVLFTSGTTSRPKGVIHSLNTLAAGTANFARITGADDTLVAFLVSPLTSSAGVMQMHLTADLHATLVLEDDFDPSRSLERVNALGATLLGGAPVIAERLLQAADARADRRIALRTMALGGAMLPRPLLELATDGFGIEIARVYGSSEAPNFSGSVPTDAREQRLADDGALMPGSEVRVGSAEHPSEGMLRGPGLFLGYVDPRDDATAFDDGWYRTGDLVEVHDGRLTVLGRLREVVNRNGLKISLQQVDAALVDLPGVRESAAFAVPDASTGERLGVALVPRADRPPTLNEVVAHLLAKGLARRTLPEQLVIWHAPLPRTASGKVVRNRLLTESPGKPSELAPRLRS